MAYRIAFVFVLLVQAINGLSQNYDTLTLGHSYEHEVEILMLDGTKLKGTLVDVGDTTLIIGQNIKATKMHIISYSKLDEIKLYRSDFERVSTTNIVIFGTAAASFFVVLKYYRDRRETLKFKNSEWLFAGIGALLSMPLAGLVSSKLYSIPRENYAVKGDLESFIKIRPELKAYAIWPYLVSQR